MAQNPSFDLSANDGFDPGAVTRYPSTTAHPQRRDVVPSLQPAVNPPMKSLGRGSLSASTFQTATPVINPGASSSSRHPAALPQPRMASRDERDAFTTRGESDTFTSQSHAHGAASHRYAQPSSFEDVMALGGPFSCAGRGRGSVAEETRQPGAYPGQRGLRTTNNGYVPPVSLGRGRLGL